jgi:hypothetical protein
VITGEKTPRRPVEVFIVSPLVVALVWRGGSENYRLLISIEKQRRTAFKQKKFYVFEPQNMTRVCTRAGPAAPGTKNNLFLKMEKEDCFHLSIMER